MPERKTADPKRGTPPGSPSSASDPRTDSAGDRSHPQRRNGGTTSVRRTRTGAATRVGQLGEGTHPGPVDGRLVPNRAARCLARCGSGPMGPPLVRGKAGWGNGDRRHGGGGSSSNLSSDSPSPEKAQTLSATRSGPAAWSSFPGWTNPQVGGFITLVMSPLITFRPSSWNRPAAGPDMAPEAASPQVGGFITLVRGVHHAANCLDVSRSGADGGDHDAPCHPYPISFTAKNSGGTDCRRTAARVSIRLPRRPAPALNWPVGERYVLSTASGWSRRVQRWRRPSMP